MAIERKSTVQIDQVLPFVGEPSIILDNEKIKMNSARYHLFKTKGVSCVLCGITGKFFAIERSYKVGDYPRTGWHLNLYAMGSDGKEVLMTKDHIVPKSKGGPDHLSNYQTMCVNCNYAKGSSLLEEND